MGTFFFDLPAPDEREAITVLPVQPDDESCRPDEVENHVRDAEERRKRGHGVGGMLERLLAENMQVALERDDRIRVRAGGGESCTPTAADQLVDAVQRHERGALHQASMGRGHEASEGGGESEGSHVHATRLGSQAIPHSAVTPTPALRLSTHFVPWIH